MKLVKRKKPKIIRSVSYNKDEDQKTILENRLCFIHHGEMKDERMSNIVRMI